MGRVMRFLNAMINSALGVDGPARLHRLANVFLFTSRETYLRDFPLL